MAERRTPRRRRRLLIGGGVALIVLVLVGAFVLPKPSSGAASTSLTATVKTADVVVTVDASGSIVDQYTYSIPASGAPVLTELAGVATGSSGDAAGSTAGTTATTTAATASSAASGDSTTKSVSVSIGQAVKKDQQLAVTTDSAGKNHAVKTTITGHVRTIATAPGASVSTVATIGAGRTLVAVDVNENRIAEVQPGQKVRVAFGTDGTTIAGTVSQIAEVADDSSGVEEYRVLVDPDSLPAGARIGMTATAAIDITRHDDVLSVPASAITEKNGHDTVQVEVGLVGDSAVEITGGLRAGQKVVVGSTGSVPASTGVRAPGA